MIKFHGTPITPAKVFCESMTEKNVLISWARPDDINRAFERCNKIILDNGAFSFWKKTKEVDWDKYYSWVSKNFKRIEHYIIPDVIDGTEQENDKLIIDFFKKVRFGYGFHHLYSKAIPVWHIHESFERLEKLMQHFNYIAFGSSGEFSQLGTEKWHKRMDEAMKIVCDNTGKPKVKIHMLRCLNPKIFTKYPFYSGDSTNLARNHNLGGGRSQWKQILERIEKHNSPEYYKFRTYYNTNSLFTGTD